MKTLNLSSYDVKEMDETQMSEVNGGEIILLVLGIVAAVAACGMLILEVVEDIGYRDGRNS